MNFTDLPICIRQDIIHSLVEKEPKYGSVSKEWFQYAVSEFGSLSFYSLWLCNIDNTKPVKYFTPYITKIWIGRCDNIDWDLIYSIKNIREVTVDFSGNESQDPCNETITKLMLLKSIESVDLNLEVDVSKCLGQLLEKNQHCLKNLSIFSDYVPYGFIVESIKFPNLTRLRLSGNSQCISTSSMTNNFPSLVDLTLDFTLYDGTIFDSDEMVNLTSLDLRSYNIGDILLKVNLSSLPKLKELYINKGFEIESTSFENTRTFKLGGSLKLIVKVLEDQFKSLERLIICTYYRDNENDLFLLKKCNLPNLKSLEIRWYDGNEVDQKLIQFFDGYTNHTVEELSIKGYTNDTSQILRHRFTNLKGVLLYLHEQTRDDNMNELFQCFKNLSKLSLNFHLCSDLLRALPSGPYSIINLSFKGLFILSSPLLTWLTHHLPRLTTLTLHWYHFRGELPSIPLTFPKLRYLVIHTLPKHRTNIEAHFNPQNYPDIKLAIFDCSCHNCYMFTTFDNHFYKDQPTISSS